MIVIDGADGEGGGQVVRTALALSLITGRAFRIANIRGGRAKPGLMRQHLTAIEAACAIGGATCDGAAIASSAIAFTPGRVTPGDYRFAVGTAGSTALVLQTVLLPLLLADAPSRLVLEGGTHAMMAPPFDFIDRVFLPIVNRMGPRVSARLIRHGFFPRGGGRIEIDIVPAALSPIDCIDRGALRAVSATALFAALPPAVAEREIATVRAHLPDWPDEAFAVRELPEDQGPGNVLLLEARFDHTTEIVTGFGRLGVSAGSLARTAAQRMAGYLAFDAFAGPYLADQLLLPFALAGGGRFTTVRPTKHTLTAADIIARFGQPRWTFAQADGGGYLAQLA